MRHLNTTIDHDSSSTLRNQVPNVRSVRSSATSHAKLEDDIGRFQDAVAIGERLEHDLETFLPLLEGVPPLFRSRGYRNRKAEFLNVKDIISGTVKTLKATRRGDVRIIASQYLLFRHMIYDNLRNLLLWVDEEMKKYNEIRQKGAFTYATTIPQGDLFPYSDSGVAPRKFK
jgi:hypothetical protein